MSLPLQSDGGNEALDLGGLVALLLSLLEGEGSADHKLPHIVFLAEVVELADLPHPLGTQPPGEGGVRQS